jgi:hypothetical protein
VGDDQVGVSCSASQISERVSQRREKHLAKDGRGALTITNQAMKKIGVLLGWRAIGAGRRKTKFGSDDPLPIDLARCQDRIMPSSAEFGADGKKWLQVPRRAERAMRGSVLDPTAAAWTSSFARHRTGYRRAVETRLLYARMARQMRRGACVHAGLRPMKKNLESTTRE